MTKRKPKFKVGQVVYLDEEGIYGIIETEMPDGEYDIRYSNGYGVWPEKTLRALTKKERG